MGGKRYDSDFVLPVNGVIRDLAVDEKGRVVTSPSSGLSDDEVVVEDGQVIPTDDGGTVTLTVAGGVITDAVYAPGD